MGGPRHVLLALVCLVVLANTEFGLRCGDYKRSVYLQAQFLPWNLSQETRREMALDPDDSS